MRNALETGAFSTFICRRQMLAQEVIDQIGAENLGSTTFTTSTSDQISAGFTAWKALADGEE